MFLSSADFFKIKFLKKSFRNTTIVSKGLDPDQDRHSVGPDLGPKLFANVTNRQQELPLARKKLIRSWFLISVQTVCKDYQ